MTPDPREERLIALLQQGIPLTEDPWEETGGKCGLSGREVLDKIRIWRESGLIRRFGAFLDHRRRGFSANAMAAWICPEDRVEAAGAAAAAFPGVSHCYERASRPDWPYNLYTMIHAASPEALAEAVEGIARAAGLTEYRVLASGKE